MLHKNIVQINVLSKLKSANRNNRIAKIKKKYVRILILDLLRKLFYK